MRSMGRSCRTTAETVAVEQRMDRGVLALVRCHYRPSYELAHTQSFNSQPFDDILIGFHSSPRSLQ